MRVLVLYAHPEPGSYVAALHGAALAALAGAGHAVDDCDLYAEGFDPVLSRAGREAYHDPARNRADDVEPHVERLTRADALVIVAPVWNFGFPAILKGYFDRVFVPGVSFTMEGGRVRRGLTNIRSVQAVLTYGADRLRAALAGDPPRRLVTRWLRATVRPLARIEVLAHYDMNRSTPESRAAFLARVEARLGR